ncbi:MAG: D-aminoacyl-tRNA deacylase [Chloroflexota bacterium]
MRALVQRVTYGKVSVDGKITAEIGQGVVILLGIGHSDNVLQADFLSDKIVNLRIFEDAEGKMNLCLLDIKGSAILVSQFTLYADTSRGRRPSFVDAALPENARPLIAYFADKMNKLGIPTGQGIFGADMLVEIHNDGPVTIWLEK